MIQGFFAELQRVVELRPELESKRQVAAARATNAEGKPETLPTTCKVPRP